MKQVVFSAELLYLSSSFLVEREEEINGANSAERNRP